jgi:hypothetical protein
VVDSRSAGTARILDLQWSFLELDRLLRGVPFHAEADVERAVFATVAHRAMRPRSAAGIAEWASRDVAIPRVSRLSGEALGEARRLLTDPAVRAAIEAAVLEPLRRLIRAVVCLSTIADPAPPAGAAGQRFAMAVTDGGVPLRLWTLPAGTKPSTSRLQAAAFVAQEGFGRLARIRAGSPGVAAGLGDEPRRANDRFGVDRLELRTLPEQRAGERRVVVKVDEPAGVTEHLLHVTDPDLDLADVARGHAAAQETARDLADLVAGSRPSTGVPGRDGGFPLTSWLALLLIRLTEYDAELPWAAVRTDLDRLHQVLLSDGTRSVARDTPLTDLQRRLLRDDEGQ